jgi:hydrogenase small subunit
MTSERHWFREELERRGVSRRDFMAFCGTVAAALSLPRSAAAQVAEALETKKKPTVIWMEFQDCAGNTESFLRAGRPSTADVVLDVLAVEYHETIMAAAGHQAEDHKKKLVEELAGEYIAVVEGSIPTGAGGAYCTVGGEAAIDIARHVCGNAAFTIAVGTCATYGGIPAAGPNPTGALSVQDAVPGATVLNLPACPMNGENLVATVIYYLTFGHLPATDNLGRPLFAYGKTIHDNCERRSHYDAGQYVEEWGDEGHRLGYCLYKVGCKGPVTSQNCPNLGWNGGTSWPIGSGHGCIGCAEPDFWDKMTPFYKHLAGFPGFGVQSNIDTLGVVATVGVAAGFATHSLVALTRSKLLGEDKPAAKDTGGEA